MIAREQHPRPRLTRADWTDLGGVWDFAYDDENRGLSERWNERFDSFDRTIMVPFPPESPLSGINDTAPHRVVWYHREIEIPRTLRDRRWLIHFGAVDYRASVWLNGTLAVTHEGGHSSFTADISDLLDPHRDTQHLVVRAEDDATDLTQPRGKQYWKHEPEEIWYHRTTGIWLPVWLEAVPQTFIRDVRWTTDLVQGRIGLTLTLNRVPERVLRARVTLTLRDRCLADDEYALDGIETVREIGFQVPNMTIDRKTLYWTPEHPNLIDAQITLIDDAPVDYVESYLGLRSVSIKDGFFCLNERPYYQRLALAQGYWPESHLAAPSGEAIRHEVELAKACGLNGLRLHQKVEDPRYLYWCDRVGMLVWGEMASAYAFTPTAIERFTREWLDVVRRDVSHPCIVAWVPFNESWGVPNLEGDPAQRHYVKALYHLTHALDPSRPVLGNDGWAFVASDIWGIHDYELDTATLAERYGSDGALEESLRVIRPYHQALALPDVPRNGQPVLLSEMGGIEYDPYDEPDTPPLRRRARTEAEWIWRLSDVMETVARMPSIVGYCYTQLADTEGEINGLLTASREPKIDPAILAGIMRQPARSMPSETTFGSAITPGASTGTFWPGPLATNSAPDEGGDAETEGSHIERLSAG